MTKHRLLSCAFCLFIASACGTMATRDQDGEARFGAFPLQAVAYDFYYMSKAFGPGEEESGAVIGGPWFLLGGLLSLPFDLFNDIIALPFDIGAWVAGRHKAWPDKL